MKSSGSPGTTYFNIMANFVKTLTRGVPSWTNTARLPIVSTKKHFWVSEAATDITFSFGPRGLPSEGGVPLKTVCEIE